jgi:hypothetical protein
MIGKLRPHPIEVTARNRRPSGEILARPVLGTTVMMSGIPDTSTQLRSPNHSYREIAAAQTGNAFYRADIARRVASGFFQLKKAIRGSS